MTQAVAEGGAGEELAQTLARTLETIRQNTLRLLVWHNRMAGLLKAAIADRKGLGGLVSCVVDMPDGPDCHDGVQIYFFGQAMTMFFISQQITRQGQLTAGQDLHQTGAAKGTHQTIDGH